MSTQTSRASSNAEAPLYRKPQADVFTVLLVIALLGLIIATTVLWMVMKDYDYAIKGGPPNPVWNAPHVNPMVVPVAIPETRQNV
jgi:hypothetical protein